MQELRREVGGLRVAALDGIDALLDRGSRLDALVARSDRLAAQARGFERSSLRLKRRERWRPSLCSPPAAQTSAAADPD